MTIMFYKYILYIYSIFSNSSGHHSYNLLIHAGLNWYQLDGGFGAFNHFALQETKNWVHLSHTF